MALDSLAGAPQISVFVQRTSRHSFRHFPASSSSRVCCCKNHQQATAASVITISSVRKLNWTKRRHHGRRGLSSLVTAGGDVLIRNLQSLEDWEGLVYPE